MKKFCKHIRYNANKDGSSSYYIYIMVERKLRYGGVYTSYESAKIELQKILDTRVVSMTRKDLKNKHKTEEHKRKISEAKRGVKFTEAHKKKLSESHKKIVWTQDHKDKVAQTHKNNSRGVIIVGKNDNFYFKNVEAISRWFNVSTCTIRNCIRHGKLVRFKREKTKGYQLNYSIKEKQNG